VRAIWFAIGLAIATYGVMTAIVIVSASGSYMAQAEGFWTYLRDRPETFLAAAWPSLAMLVAGLMAHALTERVGRRTGRVVIITILVPIIAFPLATVVIGGSLEVLQVGVLLLLLPCVLVTFIYTAMFLDSPPG
jgi:hypothetical protein